ncbi:hypothetical protein [Breoghania sp.]|nr:hypothetical protein [Breoghania sp.]MDJ0930492.1 hypothetical protein [Breoghania sp.]
MKAESYKFDASDQKVLVTYINHQSLGMPVQIDLNAGDMKA